MAATVLLSQQQGRSGIRDYASGIHAQSLRTGRSIGLARFGWDVSLSSRSIALLHTGMGKSPDRHRMGRPKEEGRTKGNRALSRGCRVGSSWITDSYADEQDKQTRREDHAAAKGVARERRTLWLHGADTAKVLGVSTQAHFGLDQAGLGGGT